MQIPYTQVNAKAPELLARNRGVKHYVPHLDHYMPKLWINIKTFRHATLICLPYMPTQIGIYNVRHSSVTHNSYMPTTFPCTPKLVSSKISKSLHPFCEITPIYTLINLLPHSFCWFSAHTLTSLITLTQSLFSTFI